MTRTPVQTINPDLFEVKLKDTDDPVAHKTKWEPAKPGGANFKTQKLEQEGGVFKVTPTAGHRIFSLIFLIPGLIAVVIGCPWSIAKGEWGTGFFFLLWGVMFGGAGAFMWWAQKPFTIDPLRGVYYRGKMDMSAPATLDPTKRGSTHDIHAIQLLSERVRSSSSSGSSAYRSYELNLVLKDGERVNVMDHGKEKAIEEAAQVIAGALNVPVWKAGF